MKIVITEWVLEPKLKLIEDPIFSKKEYELRLKLDVLLLKKFPHHEKFSNSKFWGLATVRGSRIKSGYKMKWHNVGNGKVQVRLAVACVNKKMFLCRYYTKVNEKIDQKEMMRFKINIQKIKENNFKIKGML